MGNMRAGPVNLFPSHLHGGELMEEKMNAARNRFIRQMAIRSMKKKSLSVHSGQQPLQRLKNLFPQTGG